MRRFLQVGFPQHKIHLGNVNVQNVVGNADLNLREDQTIDLDRMLAENKVYCTYLRQMFPGLIYRPNESPVVCVYIVFCFHIGQIKQAKSNRSNQTDGRRSFVS